MNAVNFYSSVLRAAAGSDAYPTSPGSAAYAATAGPAGTSDGGGTSSSGTTSVELGKDAFLRLLVTQLRYQDPINPVKDQEFIAQLAQFSALEQMNNIATQMQRLADFQWQFGGISQAASLLGRTVVILDPLTNGRITGKVDGVYLDNGTPMLIVGERRFSLSDVVEVRPD
ncbi:MAG TPA: flagellar hook capping FlgD N-terminal domain-containing protein [Limnochordales bacterium]